MRILQLVSCRGWSSDAYWAARTTRELERRGHTVTLACLPGKEARVLDGMHREGVEPVTTLAFASGVHPGADGRDLVRLRRLLERADVVHVHRGKEHWLAAVANRLIARPRPLVRTRHIDSSSPPGSWTEIASSRCRVAPTPSGTGRCRAIPRCTGTSAGARGTRWWAWSPAFAS